MIITCTANKGNSLPETLRCMGETDETDFSFLTVDKEYQVYGLMFFISRIDYLICSENVKPIWVPAHFFSIKDQKIPGGWLVNFTQYADEYADLFSMFNIHTLIGYSDLVKSFEHYVGLLEREPKHLEIFFNAKELIDKWCLEQN